MFFKLFDSCGLVPFIIYSMYLRKTEIRTFKLFLFTNLALKKARFDGEKAKLATLPPKAFMEMQPCLHKSEI